MIEVYIDGSCHPTNPGPGGIGILILGPDLRIEISESVGHATNNQAELRALLKALEWLEAGSHTLELVMIYSDSSYALNVCLGNWKAKENVPLVAQIRAAASLFSNLRWQWVKGHNGNHYNELVDLLAKKGASSL